MTYINDNATQILADEFDFSEQMIAETKREYASPRVYREYITALVRNNGRNCAIGYDVIHDCIEVLENARGGSDVLLIDEYGTVWIGEVGDDDVEELINALVAEGDIELPPLGTYYY